MGTTRRRSGTWGNSRSRNSAILTRRSRECAGRKTAIPTTPSTRVSQAILGTCTKVNEPSTEVTKHKRCKKRSCRQKADIGGTTQSVDAIVCSSYLGYSLHLRLVVGG